MSQFVVKFNFQFIVSFLQGFSKHVTHDHNMWNYIYFLLHLDSIHKNDHNALEKYINDSVSHNGIGFFLITSSYIYR